MGSTWGARGGFNNFKTRHLPHSCSPSAGPVSRRMPFLVAAPFVLRRLWVEALWVLGTQISTLVVIAIKDGVHRSRPSPALVGVLAPLNSPSFPSGHVVQYTMLLGFTFFLLYVLAPAFHAARDRTVAVSSANRAGRAIAYVPRPALAQ